MNFLKGFSDQNIDDKLEEFYRLVISYNEKFNLTSIVDKDEFFLKHIVDSLSSSDLFFKNAAVAEIGSGAGFPSVPLKIVRNDLKFTLVESNEKKCGFLNTIKEKFGFTDFNVVCARAEELSLKRDFRDSFDYSVARAVAPLDVLCELILPFVKVGGTAIAYKGAKAEEETERAKNAMETLGGKLSSIICDLSPEYGVNHSLVTIKKISKTPDGYPRRYSKIKKCPL